MSWPDSFYRDINGAPISRLDETGLHEDTRSRALLLWQRAQPEISDPGLSRAEEGLTFRNRGEAWAYTFAMLVMGAAVARMWRRRR